MQYREDSESSVAVTAKDVDLVYFVPEEGSTDASGPPYSYMTVTGTGFTKEALKKVAGQTRLGRDFIAAADEAQ